MSPTRTMSLCPLSFDSSGLLLYMQGWHPAFLIPVLCAVLRCIMLHWAQLGFEACLEDLVFGLWFGFPVETFFEVVFKSDKSCCFDVYNVCILERVDSKFVFWMRDVWIMPFVRHRWCGAAFELCFSLSLRNFDIIYTIRVISSNSLMIVTMLDVPVIWCMSRWVQGTYLLLCQMYFFL